MPGSNSRPLDLQADSHLMPDTFPTALRGPEKIKGVYYYFNLIACWVIFHDFCHLLIFSKIQLFSRKFYKLWRPFCSVEQKHLCNFVSGPYEEHLCEIIVNLGKQFKEFSIFRHNTTFLHLPAPAKDLL